MKSTRSQNILIGVLLLLAIVVVCVAPFVGTTKFPTKDLLTQIILPYRMPRIIVGFLAGASLATAGMTFQAMFRNPLATPFTLGVSSGAAFGVALAVYCGVHMTVLGMGLQTLFAFGGAIGTIGVIYSLTRVKKDMSAATMLLAGVALSFFFSSMILVLQYLGDPYQTHKILRWIMGGLTWVDATDLITLGPFVLIASGIVWWLTHDLNLLATGESLAASRGVDVDRVKLLLFFVVSLMVGAVVAFCGPIGFVGLMSPHICRMVIGADHRRLMPASWLFGGTFLVVCDTVARTVIFPTEFPVGIITSMLDG